jgi:hypothetical protein
MNNVLRFSISYNVSLNNEIIINLYNNEFLISTYTTSLKNIIEISNNILSNLINSTSILDSLWITLNYDNSMFLSPIIIAFLRCNSNKDGKFKLLNHKLEISFGKLSLIINGNNLYLMKNLIHDILDKESLINNIGLEEDDYIDFNEFLLKNG